MANSSVQRSAREKDNLGLSERYPLSVVIPARNVGHFLEPCLKALFQSSPGNLEVVVIDDASSDETPAVLRRLEGRFPATRDICLETRTGPGGARNEGLRHTRHPWVLFLDADVLLPPQAIEWIRETLDLYAHRQDVGGVLGTYSEELPFQDFATQFKNLYTCHLYRATETLSPFVHTPIFCVRRALLEEYGGFDSSLSRGEDFLLGVRLGYRGYRFVIDRRIRGVHLKRYSLGGILREDWHRIRELGRIPLSREERRFSYRAHRWNRLASVLLPGPALLLLGLGWVHPAALGAAAILGILFLACNLRFLAYAVRRRGLLFGLKSAGFLFLEMLWASLAVLWNPLGRAGRTAAHRAQPVSPPGAHCGRSAASGQD